MVVSSRVQHASRHTGANFSVLVLGFALLILATTQLVWAAGPSITSFSPTNGAPGTSVTINGKGFSSTVSNDTVTFAGGVKATISSATSTQLVVSVPGGSVNGTISVTVSGVAATSSGTFTVQYPPPTIANFTPTSVPIGATVTINGSNLWVPGINTAVQFNGSSASYPINPYSSTQIAVMVPNDATAGPIKATLNGLSGSSSTNLTIIPAPTITSVSPYIVSPPDQVTIAGTGFDPTIANDVVYICGVSANLASATSTQIVAIVPALGDGPCDVRVKIDNSYSVTQSSALQITNRPTIQGVTPLIGTTGTSVTITGQHFNTTPSNNSVYFNGVRGSVTSGVGSIQLVTAVPNGATSGLVRVAAQGQGVSRENITFIVPVSLPSVTGFTPTSAPPGTSVTISGTGFDSTPANDAVMFNGVQASVSAATTTQLVATVPSSATSGPISISAFGQQATSKTGFIVIGNTQPVTAYGYDAAGRLTQVAVGTGASQYAYEALGNTTSVNALPSSQLSIFSVSPGQGRVGDSIAVNGQGFSTTPSGNVVAFNNTTASVLSAKATQIVVVVPTGATTGSISVTVGTATATSPTSFVVTQ